VFPWALESGVRIPGEGSSGGGVAREEPETDVTGTGPTKTVAA
jgi:hypothetical protein